MEITFSQFATVSYTSHYQQFASIICLIVSYFLCIPFLFLFISLTIYGFKKWLTDGVVVSCNGFSGASTTRVLPPQVWLKHLVL
jgi:hypothetical protein